MPELPEVETTLRGIDPHLSGRCIAAVRVRQPQLRYRVPENLSQQLVGERITGVTRRSKYLLVGVADGALMLHLGMSGSLRIVPADAPPGVHDHFDLVLDSGQALRLNDPRRFGLVLWAPMPVADHRLLATLGPEPLGPDFHGAHLYRLSRGRRASVKSFIMDSHIVVGVGNIYASESLHLAGIHPTRPAGRISPARYQRLAGAIREVLEAAIIQGGTTLRNFTNGEGKPGYFRQHLRVYGRAGEPCAGCGQPIRQRVIGQRASYFCHICQK